ncbi:MAG: UDP-N-acetylmuramoyl-L-alanine--D-glutamate ligase [Chloroflexi bacterium]|nr:UDP-N-acetylmuramoyl-L-alanine--D-glutamate ligase [Chloroflexota bacterium]
MGKRVTLIGLGTRTHVSLARFLVGRGALVTISDVKPAEKLAEEIALLGDLPVRLSLGGHQEDDVLGADLVFVTPGASREIPVLVEARRRGILLSSEIELLFELCRAQTVGITGSSGKTTTTTLVGEILKAEGRGVLVGGNIGIPLIDRIDEMDEEMSVVLELSSFQLEYLKKSPRVAAVLNVTPNHLDRHHTFESYVEAKKNIVRYQRSADYAILNLDNPASCKMAPDVVGRTLFFSRQSEVREGAFIRDRQIFVRLSGLERSICGLDDLKLRGQHNVENALAAAAIAMAARAMPKSIAQVLTTFTGVEHRLEPVREIDGVRFFNDSIATSPERALAGLLSFDEPVVLIAGGLSKHLPLDDLVQAIAREVKHLVLVGELGDEIEQTMRGLGSNVNVPRSHSPSLADAVVRAAEVAAAGDVVLLSPGGTSFDEFKDFEHRGRRFKEIVNQLPSKARSSAKRSSGT